MAPKPTESQILSSFLLPPAPLSISLPLSKFTSLFPSSLQNDPAIQALYRELQSQRDEDISTVRRNIASECQRGVKQMREMRRERRRSTNARKAGEKEDVRNTKTRLLPPHSPTTLQSHLPSALEALEAEIEILETDAARILEEIKSTVGDLSDLRYGRFQKTPGANTELRDEVLDSLRRVREGAEGIAARTGEER